MRYTLGQLREAVGLSKDAFRHWKRVLTGFPHGQGHGPIFSPGDVLAFAVLRRLTETCGVRVGQLRAVSGPVFALCNETHWELLVKRMIVVDLGSQECVVLPQTGAALGDSAVVVCPLAPVIAGLRDVFLASTPLSVAAKPPGDAGAARVGTDRRASRICELKR